MNLSFENIDTFCAAIDLGEEPALIDLSLLDFIEPFAVIYLGQFLRFHNRGGKFFAVNMPPDDSRVRGYLARIRFWDRFNFDVDTTKREGLLRFLTPTSLNDVVELLPDPYVGEETAQLVENVLAGANVNVPIRAILEVVAELSDNFAQHARADLATLAVQYYPQKQQFVVAVGDSGVGIRQSLCENPQHAYLARRHHSEAIVKAFEALVSRRPEGGTGLTIVRDRVMELGGSIRVASNDGFVYMERDRVVMGEQGYELPGVQIEVRFSTK